MTGVRVVAIGGVGLAVAGTIGTALVRLVSPAPIITEAFGFGWTAMVGYLIQGLTWTSVGGLLVVRRPENAVSWLMVLVGVGYALSQLTVSMASSFAAASTAESDRLAQLAGWLTVLTSHFVRPPSAFGSARRLRPPRNDSRTPAHQHEARDDSTDSSDPASAGSWRPCG